MSKLFKVIKATETKHNTFCVKLQHKTSVTVDTAFGQATKDKQETYYLFLQSAPEIGMTAPLDLAQFDIKEKVMDMEGDNITLKYLNPK